ncbi:hypothetical protein SDC9_125463 [bioreactor metagenome]|uniref:Serine aminopeptidase S33 domain-containing protein n=1 Tax=bioreactor metagenome TaxID=1076179 RepID=A0A645CNV5_9ZZZZ
MSLGAQIVTEVLAKRPAITYYAIIESALVYTIKKLTDLSLPIYKMSYGLLNKRWFSKAQFKMSFLPMSFFEQYYQDSVRMSKESLVNMLISNGNYDLPQTIRETTAKVLIIAGDQELKVMIKSAQRLHQTIAGSELYLAEHMRHGELSLGHPQQFVEILKSFFE